MKFLNKKIEIVSILNINNVLVSQGRREFIFQIFIISHVSNSIDSWKAKCWQIHTF